MPDIVISEFMDEDAVADLARDFETHYDPALVDKPDALAGLVVGARALIVRNRTQVRGAVLEAGPKLRCVGRLGVGLDNIDLDACKTRGIQVLPATGANNLSVAEYVIAGVLMLLRGTYHASAEVLAGAWPRTRLGSGREASGRVLGLVGFGGIARDVARLAHGLDMQVAAFDPNVPENDPAWASLGVARRSFEDLLAESDAVSLHVPLLPATRHMIDAKALARLRPHTVLINAARGGVVDETALADALKAGRLGGAMLDVFEDEPLKAGSVLAGVPNLIVTPHIAGVTEEGNRRVSALTAANVRRVLTET